MKLREILRVVDPFQPVSIYNGGPETNFVVEERTPMVARQLCANLLLLDCEVLHVYTEPQNDVVLITIIRE